jgi:hypothetical protein
MSIPDISSTVRGEHRSKETSDGNHHRSDA